MDFISIVAVSDLHPGWVDPDWPFSCLRHLVADWIESMPALSRRKHRNTRLCDIYQNRSDLLVCRLGLRTASVPLSRRCTLFDFMNAYIHIVAVCSHPVPTGTSPPPSDWILLQPRAQGEFLRLFWKQALLNRSET